MNIRPYLFASAFLMANAASQNTHAQDETDALRFSNLSPQGTTRSMAIGGAVGALGGDFTSLSVNPAGIGVYRKSELTLTPSLKINNTSTKFQGVNTTDNNARFTINNFGLVLTSAAQGQRYERSKWKSVSFGVGINRVADLNHNYAYRGLTNVAQNGSGAEIFAADATQYNSDYNNPNTFAGLGYQAYLTEIYDTVKGVYQYRAIPADLVNVNQQRVVQEKGGITDINISLGGNYEEKLMLGATLGIPSAVYKRTTTYTESDPTNNTNNDFQSFDLKESLVTRGSGINLKLGAIYKPIDYLRFGLAFHSPTYFGLKDVTDLSLTSNTEGYKNRVGANGDYNPVTTVAADQRIFEYNLLTPWRTIVSATGLFGKYGFLSIDYEYVNYASARFDYDPQYIEAQRAVNDRIKSTYKGASNLRVGLEGRIDVFSVRLGASYYGSAFQDTRIKGQRLNLSAGVGFRSDNWFLDLGLIHTISEQEEVPYVVNYATPLFGPTAITTNGLNNAALTFGVKF